MHIAHSEKTFFAFLGSSTFLDLHGLDARNHLESNIVDFVESFEPRIHVFEMKCRGTQDMLRSLFMLREQIIIKNIYICS